MRSYHVRISLHPKQSLSTSQPQAADTFTPSSLWQHLPSHPPKSTARRNATYNSSGKDYRLGPIRIDWVDLENMSRAVLVGKEKEGRGPVTATFVPSTRTKSGSTNLPDGVVHVFRDSDRPKPTDATSSPADDARTDIPPDDAAGFMLGVLAVPSWMTPSDFLAFVAPAQEGMAHLRMVRDSVPNRSIVLIQFRKSEDALEFAEVYNGKTFNSVEPETCHVVRVASVSIDPDDSQSLAIARFASPQASAYELPTCPVCLERMDSAVTGLVTVPCSHTFHCVCLSKWGDSRCPVCRYSQTLRTSYPSSSNTTRSVPIPFADPSAPTLSSCADCHSATNLWICLICGNIGCGRYGRAHAHAHYERTTHLYALELETQRVWDYAGDGYVHRLIQNKADGKLVELPSASMSGATREGDGVGGGPSAADSLGAEKIEAIGIEYSYLLTSQLDSQRAYYEAQTDELRGQVDELKRLVERLGTDVAAERERARAEEERRRKHDEDQLAEVFHEKIRLEKKAEKMADLSRRLDKELKEERAVSSGLLKNLEAAKEKGEAGEKEREELKAKVAELDDQLRDLMFFLEAREKIEAGGGAAAEAAGGDITVPTPPPARTPTSARKKKNGKK
ncbi:zf-UBP-domain-containing protein [Auriscalpium vulgare]|uniref:Zf-UBP-domain-containing protein n=1 Tax=Auriscalpium vulgare TaxID=40419 RepID=A0ACB8RA90_9AGAM|nr:zf-UBP-domain-containing protein [Auriscalpium vulgare]